MAEPSQKPIVLHIGDPIKYNPAIYARFSSSFTVIRPSLEERQRPAFIQALKEKRWGDFSAIFRPFWSTGGEMGRWDRELIEFLPSSVKVFASAGAGFDWADMDVFAEKGITYCNSSLASTESVADFTLFGILSTFRHLPWCISASSTAATFTNCHLNATAVSHNPRGHILGVIGLGNIGQAIAAKAHAAFGMHIVYFDVVRKTPSIEAAAHASYAATLDELLAQSDCVVLATPARPDGSKVIDARALRQFKHGARFVNVARGSLVDEEALADALDAGVLSSVMLDVHEDEPRVCERLKGRSEVMLTCHNAGGTVDTHIGFERLSMENIEAVLRGEMPGSAVNAHLLKTKGR